VAAAKRAGPHAPTDLVRLVEDDADFVSVRLERADDGAHLVADVLRVLRAGGRVGGRAVLNCSLVECRQAVAGPAQRLGDARCTKEHRGTTTGQGCGWQWRDAALFCEEGPHQLEAVEQQQDLVATVGEPTDGVDVVVVAV
jgi:hypothetical protein